MELTAEHLSEVFKERTAKDLFFVDALSIVQNNSSGEIWLIGGFLYRNLVNGSYGNCEKPAKDFDFIVENADESIVLPEGWRKALNTFGNPKFIGPSEQEIDFVPLEKVYSIEKRKIKNPRIEDYLSGAPLNIHSIAYDVQEHRVIGDAGISALERKVVAVHHLEMAQDAAGIYETSVNDMIQKKSEELGFKAELVQEK